MIIIHYPHFIFLTLSVSPSYSYPFFSSPLYPSPFYHSSPPSPPSTPSSSFHFSFSSTSSPPSPSSPLSPSSPPSSPSSLFLPFLTLHPLLLLHQPLDQPTGLTVRLLNIHTASLTGCLWTRVGREKKEGCVEGSREGWTRRLHTDDPKPEPNQSSIQQSIHTTIMQLVLLLLLPHPLNRRFGQIAA